MSESNIPLDELQEFFEKLAGSDVDGEAGEQLSKLEVPSVLPLVDLRNNVFFPNSMSPISVGRKHTRRLLQDLPSDGKSFVVIVTQKKPQDKFPLEQDLYRVGTLALVLLIKNESGGPSSIVVRGLSRVRIEEFVLKDPYYTVRYTPWPTDPAEKRDPRVLALVKQMRPMWRRYLKQVNAENGDLASRVRVPDDPEELLSAVMMLLSEPIAEKQRMLETDSLVAQLELLLSYLQRAEQVQQIGNEIHQRTREMLEKQQREFILQQQIRTIQNELGEDPEGGDVAKFMELAKKLKCSEEVRKVFEREVSRLSRLNSMSPDYALQLSYLQLFSELPWDYCTKDNHDLVRAQKILDADHLGLEQVKDRILEFLAVLKLRKDLKSPIICLYGPPGVGKTSLGKSVAKALSRRYARMSLGGVNDEAEIRGHRRTYVGALPGRIIQSLRRVGSSNPVLILDEVDKLTTSHMGDPTSALLEVLDPEQNVSFSDHYLEVEYDLSRVLFIATANDISAIPPPLRDRMEMIEINGYLVEEKVGIAKRHLIPKLLKEHGLRKTQFQLSDELIESIIGGYTRESGVRKLNQMLSKLMRQQAKRVAMGESYSKRLTAADVRERLGIPRFAHQDVESAMAAGVAVGMAWTQTGGEILYVETSLAEGKGTLATTGNLGEVMRESAAIALQYVRSQAGALGIDAQRFDSTHVHLHVPEGAIPKDGPSAGVTMVTSIVSAFLGRGVRTGVAMTGEITLRGRILAVGGIKEKILAAKRANIRTIVLPEDNRKDLEDIKPEYMEGLEFVHVGTIDELIGFMFAQ